MDIYTLPTATSPSSEWILWHKAIKSKFGKKKSNQAFIARWDRVAGKGSQANNHELREYLQKQGVSLETTWTEDLSEFGSDTADFFSGAFTFAKIGYGVLAVIVIGATAMILYNIGKNPNKTIGAIASAKKGGM